MEWGGSAGCPVLPSSSAAASSAETSRRSAIGKDRSRLRRSCRLSPSVSINKVDLPEGGIHRHASDRSGDLHIHAADVFSPGSCSTTPRPTSWAPTSAFAGSISPAASCSSSTTTSGTPHCVADPCSRTAPSSSRSRGSFGSEGRRGPIHLPHTAVADLGGDRIGGRVGHRSQATSFLRAADVDGETTELTDSHHTLRGHGSLEYRQYTAGRASRSPPAPPSTRSLRQASEVVRRTQTRTLRSTRARPASSAPPDESR